MTTLFATSPIAAHVNSTENINSVVKQILLSERFLFYVLGAMFISFIILPPYANQLSIGIVILTLLLAICVVPAALNLFLFRKQLLELYFVIPILALGITVGGLNGHHFSDIVRGLLPFSIYIVAISAFLFIDPKYFPKLSQTFVVAALILALKTFAILALNNIGLDKLLSGHRGTFYDINSGLPFAATAIPLTLLAFQSKFLRFTIISILLMQILIGQSKSLIILTGLSFFVLFFFYEEKTRSSAYRFYETGIKMLVFATAILIAAATFSSNPVFQRFNSMVQNPQLELGGRFYEMKNSIRQLDETPIFGKGHGYVFIHKKADSPVDAPEFEERRYVHSTFFYHLALFGLFGAPFIMLMFHGPLLYGLLITFGTIGLEGSAILRERRRVLLILTLCGLTLFGFNMISASYKNPQSLILLAFVNAYILTIVRGSRSESRAKAI